VQPDREYLDYLMSPFTETASLAPAEYVAALRRVGVEVVRWMYVNPKFLEHFEYLIATQQITNLKGTAEVIDFGFYIGADKAVALIDSCRIIKSKK
jgi:hypothetical protein